MKKIKTHFLIYFVLLILLSNILVGVLLFHVASKTFKKEGKIGLKNLTEYKAKEYEEVFNNTVTSVQMISDLVEKTLSLKMCKKIAPTAHNYNLNNIPYVSNYLYNVISPSIYIIISNTSNVLGGYFNFNLDLIKHQKALATWFTRVRLDQPLHYEDSGLTSSYYPSDSPSLKWYYKPIQLKKGYWSNIYIDNDIKIKMISYSKPVYIQKELVGVAGIDISLEQITKAVSDLTLYKTGYAILLDNNLNFICSKNNKDKLESEKYKYLIEKIKSMKNDVITITENNEKWFLSYAQLSNGFVLLTKVPQREVLENLNKLKLLFVEILLLFLIISVYFSHKIAKKIAKPIEKITKASNKLAESDFDIILPDNSDIEEIDNLSNSLKEFSIIYQEHWENENLLNLIMSNIPDGILIINSCIIESCNEAVTNIFGYEKNEIIGSSLNKFLTTDEINYENCLIINVFNKKKEVAGIHKDGRKMFIEIIAKEIMVKNQKRCMVILRDISEQKEVDTMKNNFISMISHELRTPLTSIKGGLGLISSGKFGNLPDKISSLIDIASNNTTRLINLINDILDLEKIQAGKMIFNFEEYEIMTLVEESIKLNKEYAMQYNIEYKIVEPLEKASIKTDKDKLIQVLTNLLSNAAKFSDTNEIVEISVTRNQGAIRVSITNKGHGIPEESYSKLFEAFSQIDSSDSRKRGGSGLGLNISQLIIKKMGGKIGFNSVVDNKTTFYIELKESI